MYGDIGNPISCLFSDGKAIFYIEKSDVIFGKQDLGGYIKISNWIE